MAIFPEANARLFKNMFVCKRCKTKQRVPPLKLMAGKVKCRSCTYPHLRPVRRK